MRTMRNLILACLLLGILPGLAEPASCSACPMCKTATETADDQSRPVAYMASILTMLSMPSILFAVVGVTLYRMTRREESQLADLTKAHDRNPDEPLV